MNERDTGRQALPQNDAVVNRINNEQGMTLRDYFATHGPMPGEAEIADHCKVVLKTHADPYTDAPTFGTWWAGLSLEEKCDAFAGVRYAIADAMLRARNK